MCLGTFVFVGFYDFQIYPLQTHSFGVLVSDTTVDKRRQLKGGGVEGQLSPEKI